LEEWGIFATVAGAAAAGLTGLLFVAVSIRTSAIAQSQELRNRAAQTLALFVTVLFITILLSIPGQSYSVLGVEFVALALISGVGLLMLDRRARADTHQRDTGAPNAITSILLLVAGVLLIFGVRAGLDVVVLPVLVALAGGVTSAWLVLTKVTE
jgi:hypothetical protein